MQTMPMPLDALSAANNALGEFQVDSPREIAMLLRQLCDGSVMLNLNASDGSVVGATLWTLDTERGTLGFSVDPGEAGLESLLECEEAVVVGYLDNIKLQFDVQDVVAVRGPRGCVLNCRAPRVLYRFQRRNAYRVRPLLRSAPVARLRHPAIAEMRLALRVIDVSIGGCALFLPEDVPALQPGTRVDHVEIELDADTRFRVDLRLQHVTSNGAEASGVRLGCEFVRAEPAAQRSLQRYIDQTQKRGRLLSLD
jgi:c-di-GMP-binding flagellar brake protein YcgR